MNNNEKSLVDTAYDILSEAYVNNGNQSIPMAFNELVYEIGQRKGLSEDKLIDLASVIYTVLTTDGRFVIKGENKWVLKEHVLFKDIHIDMNDAYEYDDEDEDEDEDEKKEKSEDEDSEEDDEDEESKDEDELGIEGADDEAPVTSGDDEDDAL